MCSWAQSEICKIVLLRALLSTFYHVASQSSQRCGHSRIGARFPLNFSIGWHLQCRCMAPCPILPGLVGTPLRISFQKVDGTCYSSILSSFRTRSAPWSLALLRLQGLRLDLGNAALLVDAIQGKPQGAWIEGCHQLNQLEDEGMKLWSTSAGSLFGAMLRKLQAAQQWLKAMELFEMLEPECRIQTSFAGNVLACLRGAGLREEALHLCQELSKNQLQLDQQLLGVVLSLCDRADLWQTALSIFTSPWPCPPHLSTDGLVAQGATIASCASAGQWRWCIRLLPTSGRRMVPGPMGNALMNAMAKARAWKASVSWLRMGSSPLGLSAMNAFTSAMLAAPEWARVMEPWDKRELLIVGCPNINSIQHTGKWMGGFGTCQKTPKQCNGVLLFVAYICKWLPFGAMNVCVPNLTCICAFVCLGVVTAFISANSSVFQNGKIMKNP